MRHSLIIICGVLLLPTFSISDRCEEIDVAFSSVVESNDDKKSTLTGGLPACQCYTEPTVSSKKTLSFGEDGDDLWIGCTGYNMPAVFRALDVLNETFVSRLVIWNSLINLVPSDMFSKVRPKTLTLENCMVSFLRPNAFGNIGRRMKILNLRNNAFQRIEPSIAKELPGLVKLDLSGNKISVIEKNSFVGLTLLEELSLDNNQISEIHDGEFNGLKNLKTLNLANNKLAKITKNTFNGLDNLEILILKGNNLADVDWAAFSGLKKLRTLDLGTNQLTNIELRRLQNLQRLYLNNNSIQSLKNVVLRDLPNLVSLSLDRNSITRISDDDLSELSQSGRLTSLSIVSNKISEIESRAFEHVHELSILSLQHNELTQLTSPTTNGMVPFLRPLKKLKSLYLSNNKIAKIDADSLQGLVRLKEISLDHNNIRTVDTGAFHGIQLNKLFLNGNQLYYLPKGLFDEWNKNDIYAIDLSDNVWECVCSGGEEWLANWLHSVGEANTPQGKLGCLIEQCVPSTTDHPPWIIAIAIAFSTISVVCIIVIAFLLLQEGKRPRLPSFMNHIQRVPSDREKLISDHLAFPNPVTSIPDQVMPTRASIKLAGSSNNGTRKKVHFDDS